MIARDPYAALDPRARDVLDCWFGAPGSPEFGVNRKQWFKRNAAFDAMLRTRFGGLIDAGLAGELDDWEATPLGALALVIVFDQFSRNCYRHTARAFAADPAALPIARRMVAKGADRLLPGPYHRAFAYLPFSHSETMESQRESLRLFSELDNEAIDPSYYRFAVRRAEVIERFGRYPHRNAALGRESTDEERAFLSRPRSSF
ncbi:DUF924 family protein [Paraburkholderia solisilvae]|uniref:Transmembrane protein n=1 Tax=Paraburkholderia solisilvae TaxID=624376 RepID=A0A6J5D332_9BURK|nr:DUF924 family protein [Paraburkholderia solisilvae]CAB3748618.1 hypothetical protein LMG29739_00550 [Paraburkholderia solisilvae]